MISVRNIKSITINYSDKANWNTPAQGLAQEAKAYLTLKWMKLIFIYNELYIEISLNYIS